VVQSQQRQSQILDVSLVSSPKNVAAARTMEKRSLQGLNEKLSEYVGQTSALTAENKRLRHDLDALNAVFAGLDDRLRKQYELQIKSLREALDKAVAEKSVALKKVSYMADDLKKSETALVKETWNHENTKKKVPELESMIVERDGQIDFLTKNMGKGQEELKVMKTKLNSVQLELGCAHQGVEMAAVDQIQHEVDLQAKTDEIEFLKDVYKEQIELLSQIEISNNTICCPDHLIETLKDIRADYEAVIRARESADPDAWYRTKFDQVMKIGEQKREALATEKKKVEDLRKKCEKLRDDLDGLEKELEEERKKRLRSEENLAEAVEENASSIREKDEAIDALKAEFAQLMEMLRRLVDPDLAVTGEINEAKKLLQAGGGNAVKVN